MSSTEQWSDLRERLHEAVANLEMLMRDGVGDETHARLSAKAAGVKLALSYMDEYDTLASPPGELWSSVPGWPGGPR